MRTILLIFLAILPAVAQTPDFTQPSIFITLDSNFPDSLIINRVSCGLDEGRSWLGRASAQYGRQVPVVVIADRKVPLGAATDTVKMALASHDHVCGVVRGATVFDPLRYFTTGTLSDPTPLLHYLKPPTPIYFAPGYFQASSSDSKALYTPPPKELVDRLTTPTIE